MKTYVYMLTGDGPCCSSNLEVFATRVLAELAQGACEAWIARYDAFTASLPEPWWTDRACALSESWTKENPPPYADLESTHYRSYCIEEFSVTGAG